MTMINFTEAMEEIRTLKSLLEQVVGQRDVLREKQAAWLASPEAAKRLDGYRELGEKCAALEAEVALLENDCHDGTCHVCAMCYDTLEKERDTLKAENQSWEDTPAVQEIQRKTRQRDEARANHQAAVDKTQSQREELEALRAQVANLMSIISDVAPWVAISSRDVMTANSIREMLLDVEGRILALASTATVAAEHDARVRREALEEAADAIKHNSHEDGLGMGSQRLEAIILSLAAKEKP